MSGLAPPVEHHPDAIQGPRRRPLERRRGQWGMWLFIGTEGMLFAQLFFAYAYLGSMRPEWPPEHDPSLTYPLILLAILLVSSVTVHWGEKGIKQGSPARLTAGIVLTLLLSAVFLVIQRFEYVHHLKSVTPATNAYGSILFTIISFHLAHLIVGLCMLVYILARNLAGHFSAERHLAVQNSALYWHFVDLVWVLVVFTVYVTPHLYD